MRTPALRLFPFLLIASLGACISLEEAPMVKDSIQKGQRTVVIVFPAPGPFMSETDNKLENAAKLVPGLSLMLAASQGQRNATASADLQQYLPPSWHADEAFYPILLKELAASGNPGPLLTPAEAGLSELVLKNLNRADNVNDWQLRYCVQIPDSSVPPVPRNYASVLSLDDAVVLEINLACGAPSDGEGNWTPAVSAVTKLYRVNSMKLLWRHDDTVEDKAGVRTSYDFKTQPADLISKWQKLMPALAQLIVSNYRKNLQAAGVYVAPAPSPLPVPLAPTPPQVAPAPVPVPAISTQTVPVPLASPVISSATTPAPAVSASTATAR